MTRWGSTKFLTNAVQNQQRQKVETCSTCRGSKTEADGKTPCGPCAGTGVETVWR
jgi:DnaJ-class molecular chaperone